MIKKTAALLLFAAFLLPLGCSGNNRQAAFNTGQRMSLDMSPVSAPMVMAREREAMTVRAFSDAGRQWMSVNDQMADIPETAVLDNAGRKLVRSANLRIRVENLDAAGAFIENLMRQYNAYAASTHIEENSRHYSLRVPAQHYDAFLAEMSGVGRLLNRFESTEDVTLRYFDLEGRLANQRELLRTFQSYLGRAANIEEILAVEARIADLLFEIERTETQFRHLANRVEYSTIDVSLLGPVALSPARNITLAERIRQLFGNFGGFLSTIAVILIGIVIYGIPSLLLLGLLFLLLFGKIGLVRKLWRRIKS